MSYLTAYEAVGAHMYHAGFVTASRISGDVYPERVYDLGDHHSAFVDAYAAHKRRRHADALRDDRTPTWHGIEAAFRLWLAGDLPV